jgi:selenocysteine-specific elongation factor
VHAPVTGPALQAHALLPPRELAHGLAGVRSAGDWYFSEEWLQGLKARVRERLRLRAERDPLDPGLPLGQLLLNRPWANAIAPLLELERRGGKLYLAGSAPSLGAREEDARRLEAEVAENGFAKADDRELAAFLETAGRLYRVGDGFAVSRDLYERGTDTIQTLAPITLASFRDALGISRRVAQLLLERYDADGLTRRVGDERVLRRAAKR